MTSYTTLDLFVNCSRNVNWQHYVLVNGLKNKNLTSSKSPPKNVKLVQILYTEKNVDKTQQQRTTSHPTGLPKIQNESQASVWWVTTWTVWFNEPAPQDETVFPKYRCQIEKLCEKQIFSTLLVCFVCEAYWSDRSSPLFSQENQPYL